MSSNNCEESETESLDFLEEIENELTSLTKAGEKVNEIQNNLSLAQQCLEQLHENYKKRMVDLRLRYKKRIDEAQHYHRAVKESEELGADARKILVDHQEKLRLLALAKEQITIGSSLEYTQKLNEINALRESAKNCLADHRSVLETQQTKLACVEDLQKRYRRSIELTREYFDTRESGHGAIAQQKKSVDELRESLNEWKECYRKHMRNLEALSERKHLERSETMNRLQQTIANQQSMSSSETDNSSLASYNLDTLDSEVLREANENDSESRFTQSLSIRNSHSMVNSCPNSPFKSFGGAATNNSRPYATTGYIVRREEDVQSHPLA